MDYFILGPIPFKALSLLPLSFVCIYLRSIRTIRQMNLPYFTLFFPVSSSHIRDRSLWIKGWGSGTVAVGWAGENLTKVGNEFKSPKGL